MTALNGTLSEIEKAFAGLPEALQATPEIADLRRAAEQILLGDGGEISTNLKPTVATDAKQERNGVAGALAKIQAAIGNIPLDAIKKNPELWKKIVDFRNKLENTFQGFASEIALSQ